MLLVATTGSLPQGPGFTIVLVLHVATVAASLVTVTTAAVHGWLATSSAGGGREAAIRRYFRPGADVAGRVLYAVPVTGVALVALSGGRFGVGDRFVVVGSGLWLVAAVVAELALWPAVRLAAARLAVTSGLPGAVRTTFPPEGVGATRQGSAPSEDLGRVGRRIVAWAAVVGAIVLLASVVMVLRP